jgi:hypothetical protein
MRDPATGTGKPEAVPSPSVAVRRLDIALNYLDETIRAANAAEPSCAREARTLDRIRDELVDVHGKLRRKDAQRKAEDAQRKARSRRNGND